MSPGHVVLKGGRVTRARPRARGGRNATGQATGLWRIFYKYGSRLGTSPEFSGGGINNYYVVYAETRSFLLGRGGRGPSALTGAIEKGTGTGMARSAGAGRRNPNMSGPSRSHRAPRRRHRPHDTADSHQGSPAAGTGHWDWAVCRGSRVGRDGGTAGCGWRVAGSVGSGLGLEGVGGEPRPTSWRGCEIHTQNDRCTGYISHLQCQYHSSRKMQHIQRVVHHVPLAASFPRVTYAMNPTGPATESAATKVITM